MGTLHPDVSTWSIDSRRLDRGDFECFEGRPWQGLREYPIPAKSQKRRGVFKPWSHAGP
jgi:hypothetical protein